MTLRTHSSIGSDQLWNRLIGRVNDDLFLDFVRPQNDRVAYATSFGNRGADKFKLQFLAKHAANLQKFKAISVREDYAVDTARDIFGAKASLVVDPVFLLPQEHYVELASKATVSTEGEYMAVFFLDPTPEKRAVAQAIADQLGFEKIFVIPNPDDGREHVTEVFADEPRAEILAADAPENFLRGYRDASYVVTDSFHGTAFATVFEKPFSSIYNAKRGADRFSNLLAALGFGDTRRVFESDNAESIASNPNVTREIRFEKAREYIEAGRAASMEWLKNALDPAKKDSAALDPSKIIVLPPPQKFELHNPEFTTNSPRWKISKSGQTTRLRVARGGAVPGNVVWTELPQPLKAGSGCQLKITWTPQTTAPAINIHLRNAETGKFRVVGKVDVPQKQTEPRTDTLNFNVPEAGLSQIMLGALHFTGRHAGAEVQSIEVEAMPSGRANALAIPSTTPSREQIILNVINDPRVQQAKERIVAMNPDLTLYVGREMKEYTHNKVGGPADLLAFPKTIEEFHHLVSFALDNDVPYTVLGRGSNIIVRDGGIRGLVIMTTGLNYFQLKDGRFTAGAGSSFIEASYFLLEHGLSTLEWASGIPGTVGGAVYMNAGTNVSDIRATIHSVKFLDHLGRLRDFKKEDISWGKRHSTFQEHANWIILEATFDTKPSDRVDLSKKMLATVQVRENHFPLESPNHGSTFKWWRAPRLIMQAGLTGFKMGGAQISTKQPGFFV